VLISSRRRGEQDPNYDLTIKGCTAEAC